MRRPSPLPPAAAPPQADAPVARTPSRAARENVDATEAIDADVEQPAAPIIPLAAPIPGRPAEIPPDGSDDSDGSPDPGGADPSADRVGVRAVWAAARARRRALRAEVRRFTVRQRRRRAVWLGVAASVVILVLATLGAAYSPLFAVEDIRVVGAEKLDVAAVEDALAGQLGTPLPLVDESAVKAALIPFPLVESYQLEARPPHELVVRIVERTPIGYLQTRAGFTLVDAAGVALSTSAAAGTDAPLLTVSGVGSPAFEAIGRVMRTLPETIRPQVTAVAARSPDDVTLTLGATGTQIVWGSAEESVQKSLVLQAAMTARPPGTVSVYDVSSADAVVMR